MKSMHYLRRKTYGKDKEWCEKSFAGKQCFRRSLWSGIEHWVNTVLSPLLIWTFLFSCESSPSFLAFPLIWLFCSTNVYYRLNSFYTEYRCELRIGFLFFNNDALSVKDERRNPQNDGRVSFWDFCRVFWGTFSNEHPSFYMSRWVVFWRYNLWAV